MQRFSLSSCGNLEFFIHPSCPSWGGFHVTFQDRYFLFYSVIVFGHKSLEALPVRGALLSEVLTTRRLKRYFNRRSTKQQWQVHPGDTFQPQGLTPTPMTRRTSSIFSPGRSSRRFGPFFLPWQKAKAFKVSRSVNSIYSALNAIYVSPSPQKLLSCAFVPSCQYAIFLVLFLYLLFTLYCALRCEKYIGKIKISTDYAFKWLQMYCTLSRILFRFFTLQKFKNIFLSSQTNWNSLKVLITQKSDFIKKNMGVFKVIYVLSLFTKGETYWEFFFLSWSTWSHMDPFYKTSTNAPNVHHMGNFNHDVHQRKYTNKHMLA